MPVVKPVAERYVEPDKQISVVTADAVPPVGKPAQFGGVISSAPISGVVAFLALPSISVVIVPMLTALAFKGEAS